MPYMDAATDRTYEAWHCAPLMDTSDPDAWIMVHDRLGSAEEAWEAAKVYQDLYGGEVLVEEVRRKTVRHSVQS